MNIISNGYIIKKGNKYYILSNKDEKGNFKENNTVCNNCCNLDLRNCSCLYLNENEGFLIEITDKEEIERYNKEDEVNSENIK